MVLVKSYFVGDLFAGKLSSMFPPLEEEGRHVTAHPNVTMLLKLELVSTHFMVKASSQDGVSVISQYKKV